MDYVLLVAALGMVLLVSAANQRVERERRRVSEAKPTGRGHDLSPYELAYLSGGPRRAINTALAVLATAGAIRVSRGSHVTPVRGARPSPVPIEQAVLHALAVRPGGYRAGELRRALQTHPALTDLVSGLEGRGLIVREHAFGPAWRRRQHLQIAAGVAVGFMVLLFVLAVVGLAANEPVFLGALFFGGIAVLNGLVASYRKGRRLRNIITREGREVLLSAHQHHPRGVRDQSSLAMAVGLPVALYGLADAGDQTLCAELSAGDPNDCAGSCGTYSGGDGTTFGSDSYGGLDFGGGSSSCGGSSSSCGGSSSSCGGGSSSCGGGGSSCGSS
ncbi:TIGR04222 domain-containing membrane protein [Nonomuraea basaltis]|uniref:TIGR04222 domain-containing membrane protein n=1 Tax=Nonomuraea basaltis TaxID=2495887 RepID=UPI00110C70D8|nr:TIGR04222 domain-containing membrane protein [Nonomuraea basaltis]TMR97590.1 TIGR04222 domain-containing membrane protein [Nonomuraea basaltis]